MVARESEAAEDNLIRLSLARWLKTKKNPFSPPPKYGYLNPDPKKVARLKREEAERARKRAERLAKLNEEIKEKAKKKPALKRWIQ